MKKFLFLSTLFVYFLCFSQNDEFVADKTVITFWPKTLFLYEKYNNSSCHGVGDYNKKYSSGNMLFVSDIYDCEFGNTKEKYASVFFDGKVYYVELNDEDLFIINSKKYTVNEAQLFLNSLSKTQKDNIISHSENLSSYYIDYLKSELHDKIFKNKNLGIGIINAYPVEEYSFTGATFEIINFSSKRIKYITFNFYGKNAVADKVGGNLSLKGIGPVDSNSISSWTFDSVWYTDVVQTLKLTSVLIQYFDGTSKTIPITEKMWVDEDDLFAYQKLLNE